MEKVTISEKVISPEEMQKELNRKNKFPPIVDKKTKENFPPTKEAMDESKAEREKLSQEKLQKISNHDFLRLSFESRLQYITKNNIDSKKIASGEIKNIEFTFTFDGKFNRELYLKTTAGQVLPKEVEILKSGGQEYKRNGLAGEFFTSGGARLIIKEGTNITVEKIRTAEEIKKLQEENNKNIQEFIEKNKESEKYSDIVSEAIKRGIDPKFAILAFGEQVSKAKDVFEKSVLIEEMFTEYDRKKGKSSSVFKNSKEGILISVLKEFNSDWKEKAKQYGIEEKVIEEVINSSSRVNLDLIDGNVGIENNNGKLSFIPRLQNTGNIAEDLNNPANLIAGGIGDKYAIGKVKSPNGRNFLVFRNIQYGFKAMASDIEAKQKGYSKVISPNATLSKFIDVWVGNDGTQGTNARRNYKNIVIRELNKKQNISINDGFKYVNPLELAKALSKAEGFRGGNNLYENFNV